MPAKGTSPRERWNPLLKSYPDSEKVNAVSIGAETMFTRLVAKADDYGNYWASPRKLLSGLYCYRWDNGDVDETLMVRWRNELATCSEGPLIVFYSVNGKDYLHLINPRRRFRTDTTPEELVPREPPNIDEKALSEHVPQTHQERTGHVPLDLDSDLDQDLDLEKEPSSDPDTYPTKKGRTLKGDKLRWFEEFWLAFAYKSGKAAAADSWLDIKGLNRELVDAIIEGAGREFKRRATLREDQTAIMAQGWLTARRWEDEHVPSGNGADKGMLTHGAAYYEKARGKGSNVMHFDDDADAAEKFERLRKGGA